MPEHDVIVVGGGVAALRAAVAASETADVAIVSKIHPIRSGAASSAGGVNAALKPPDSWESHANDTVTAGDFLASQSAVETFCSEAPLIVDELERFGAAFSRDAEGRLAQRQLGGSSVPRAAYASDWTGIVLVQTLWEQALRAGVKIYDDWFPTKLVIRDGRVGGIIALSIRSGGIHSFAARAVILATEGAGQAYATTTNGAGATGDGFALGYREGLNLRDMEFVQFNPTALHLPDGLMAGGIGITEAARAEGGFLVNGRGDHFMRNYAPRRLDLAPRDVVSRAIRTEIDAGRGADGGALLDLTRLNTEHLSRQLPHLRRLCSNVLDKDPAEHPIPVAPAAHFIVGGIPTDMDGRTTVEGLFAAGECAHTDIHGASPLAGNAAAEAMVLGRRAGMAAAMEAHRHHARVEIDHDLVVAEREGVERIRSRRGDERVAVIASELGRLMDSKAGVFRSQAGLEAASAVLRSMRDRLERLRLSHDVRHFNQEIVSALELANLVDVAHVIVASAAARTESRGCHFRSDHPARDDQNWTAHTVARINGDVPVIERQIASGVGGHKKVREY